MKFKPSAVVLLLFLFLGLVPFQACALESGAPAPGFRLRTLDGQEVSLADFKGQVVLLKLATTWCPACSQLTSEIKKVGGLLKEKGVVLLEVFVQDSEAMIKDYLADAEYPMTAYALLDDGQAYQAYNVYLIPRLLVIDAGQHVRFDRAGGNIGAEEILSMVNDASITGSKGPLS